MENIEIRLAQRKDISGIMFIHKNTWLTTYPNKEYGITQEDILEKDFDSLERAKRWINQIENLKTKLFVALTSEKVVGFCNCSKENDENQIMALYILPEYQGQGIGKSFINRAFDWFDSNSEISLEVAVYNKKAINFYKKMGFTKETAVEPNHPLPNGKFIPTVKLTKMISD